MERYNCQSLPFCLLLQAWQWASFGQRGKRRTSQKQGGKWWNIGPVSPIQTANKANKQAERQKILQRLQKCERAAETANTQWQSGYSRAELTGLTGTRRDEEKKEVCKPSAEIEKNVFKGSSITKTHGRPRTSMYALPFTRSLSHSHCICLSLSFSLTHKHTISRSLSVSLPLRDARCTEVTGENQKQAEEILGWVHPKRKKKRRDKGKNGQKEASALASL